MIRALAFSIAMMLSADTACAETIDIAGVARSYLSQFPETRPAPLVLVLHGNTQQGDDMRTRTSWPDVAKREGFVAVFPDGLNRAWADLRGHQVASDARRLPAPTMPRSSRTSWQNSCTTALPIQDEFTSPASRTAAT